MMLRFITKGKKAYWYAAPPRKMNSDYSHKEAAHGSILATLLTRINNY
jgi:hypothetical protein